MHNVFISLLLAHETRIYIATFTRNARRKPKNVLFHHRPSFSTLINSLKPFNFSWKWTPKWKRTTKKKKTHDAKMSFPSHTSDAYFCFVNYDSIFLLLVQQRRMLTIIAWQNRKLKYEILKRSSGHFFPYVENNLNEDELIWKRRSSCDIIFSCWCSNMWLAALVMQDDCETNVVQWEIWSKRNERQK